jgi:hypothetical protein
MSLKKQLDAYWTLLFADNKLNYDTEGRMKFLIDTHLGMTQQISKLTKEKDEYYNKLHNIIQNMTPEDIIKLIK